MPDGPGGSTQPPTHWQEVLGHTQAPWVGLLWLFNNSGLLHLPEPIGTLMSVLGLILAVSVQWLAMALPVWIALPLCGALGKRMRLKS